MTKGGQRAKGRGQKKEGFGADGSSIVIEKGKVPECLGRAIQCIIS